MLRRGAADDRGAALVLLRLTNGSGSGSGSTQARSLVDAYAAVEAAPAFATQPSARQGRGRRAGLRIPARFVRATEQKADFVGGAPAVEVNPAPVSTRLLTVPWRSFFEVLRSKLHWGDAQ